MKNLLIFFLLLSFSLNASERQIQKVEYEFYLSGNIKVKHGIFKNYYPDGRVESSGKYFEDKFDGKWKYWHKDGQLAKSVTYDKGVKEGVVKEWHSNSKLKSERDFIKGRENGKSYYWHENSAKHKEIIWRNGNKHGFETHWHPSGNTALKTYYKNGAIHGYLYEWDDLGKKTSQRFFVNGREIRILFKSDKYGNGNMKLNYSYYLDGNEEEIKHGKYTKYFPNGELWIQAYYFHDKLHGKWQYGKKDGLHCRIESWKYGQKHGVFSWWHQGKITKEEEWFENKKVSSKTY